MQRLHPQNDSWPSVKKAVEKDLFPNLKECKEPYQMVQKSTEGKLVSWQDKCAEWRNKTTSGDNMQTKTGNAVATASVRASAKSEK